MNAGAPVPTFEVMTVDGGRPVKLWTHGVPVEEGARAVVRAASDTGCAAGRVCFLAAITLGT